MNGRIQPMNPMGAMSDVPRGCCVLNRFKSDELTSGDVNMLIDLLCSSKVPVNKVHTN